VCIVFQRMLVLKNHASGRCQCQSDRLCGHFSALNFGSITAVANVGQGHERNGYIGTNAVRSPVKDWTNFEIMFGESETVFNLP